MEDEPRNKLAKLLDAKNKNRIQLEKYTKMMQGGHLSSQDGGTRGGRRAGRGRGTAATPAAAAAGNDKKKKSNKGRGGGGDIRGGEEKKGVIYPWEIGEDDELEPSTFSAGILVPTSKGNRSGSATKKDEVKSKGINQATNQSTKNPKRGRSNEDRGTGESPKPKVPKTKSSSIPKKNLPERKKSSPSPKSSGTGETEQDDLSESSSDDNSEQSLFVPILKDMTINTTRPRANIARRGGGISSFSISQNRKVPPQTKDEALKPEKSSRKRKAHPPSKETTPERTAVPSTSRKRNASSSVRKPNPDIAVVIPPRNPKRKPPPDLPSPRIVETNPEKAGPSNASGRRKAQPDNPYVPVRMSTGGICRIPRVNKGQKNIVNVYVPSISTAKKRAPLIKNPSTTDVKNKKKKTPVIDISSGESDEDSEYEDDEEEDDEDEDDEDYEDDDSSVTTRKRILRPRTKANIPSPTHSEDWDAILHPEKYADLEDVLGVCLDKVSPDIKALSTLQDKKSHKAKEPISIKKKDLEHLMDLVSLWIERLIEDGYLQFRIEDFKNIPPKFWEAFAGLKYRKKGDGFRMDDSDPDPIYVSVQQVWRVAEHLFYTCTAEGEVALSLLPCLQTKTMGEIQSSLEKMFGVDKDEMVDSDDETEESTDDDEQQHNPDQDKISKENQKKEDKKNEKRGEKFFNRLYQLEINKDRTGPGMLVPYINLYKYVDIEDSKKRAGFDMNTLESPIRTEMNRNPLGFPINDTGITDSMTYIGFSGSFFCAHIEDSCYNSCNLNVGGDVKLWAIVPGTEHSRVVAKLMEEYGMIETEADDFLKEYNTECTLHHKRVMITPRLLEIWGIRFKLVNQRPGDLLVLGSKALHFGCNLGFNIAYASNCVFADYHRMCKDGIKQCPHPYFIPHTGTVTQKKKEEEKEIERAKKEEEENKNKGKKGYKKKDKVMKPVVRNRYKINGYKFSRLLALSAQSDYKGIAARSKEAGKVTDEDLKNHPPPIVQQPNSDESSEEDEICKKERSPCPSPTLDANIDVRVPTSDEEKEIKNYALTSNRKPTKKIRRQGSNNRPATGAVSTPSSSPFSGRKHGKEGKKKDDSEDNYENDDDSKQDQGTFSQEKSASSIMIKQTEKMKKKKTAHANKKPYQRRDPFATLFTPGPTELKKFKYDIKYWMRNATPLTDDFLSQPQYLDSDALKSLNELRPSNKQFILDKKSNRWKCPSCNKFFPDEVKCLAHIQDGTEHALYGSCRRPNCNGYFNCPRTVLAHMMLHWIQDKKYKQYFDEKRCVFKKADESDPSLQQLQNDLKIKCDATAALKIRKRENAKLKKEAAAKIKKEAEEEDDDDEVNTDEGQAKEAEVVVEREHEVDIEPERQQKAVIERQKEAVIERQQGAEVNRTHEVVAERQKEADIERKQGAKAEGHEQEVIVERQHEVNAERQKEADLQRQRKVDAERQKESEVQRQHEVDAERQKEADLQRQRKVDAERQKEADLQRQHEVDAERQKEADLQRQHEVDVERQKESEVQRTQGAEAEGREQEVIVERQHEVDVERQKESEVQRTHEVEKESDIKRQQGAEAEGHEQEVNVEREMEVEVNRQLQVHVNRLMEEVIKEIETSANQEEATHDVNETPSPISPQEQDATKQSVEDPQPKKTGEDNEYTPAIDTQSINTSTTTTEKETELPSKD